MRKSIVGISLVLFSTLMLLIPTLNVNAVVFPWAANVSSDGTPVVSPTLQDGREYTITAKTVFNYGGGNADAKYFTNDTSHGWIWGNHFPAPENHSFLQIDGMDVDWGPFDNGEIIDGVWLGHEYTITYIGDGNPITFAIVDWMDMDFTNNWCHLVVVICEGEMVGHSPGWWKHQFKVHYDPKGHQKLHVSWSDILMWTADIDAAARILPTPWDLPPLADIGHDGDGFFTTDDAYDIFTAKDKAWKMMWLSVATGTTGQLASANTWTTRQSINLENSAISFFFLRSSLD